MLEAPEICIAYWPLTQYSVKPIGQFWIPLTSETTEEEVRRQIQNFAEEDIVTELEKMVWCIHDFRGFPAGMEIEEDANLGDVIEKAAIPF
jgi:hypothetical protein